MSELVTPPESVRLEIDTWPLGARDFDTAAGWLLEEHNARWLDFGMDTPALSPAVLKMMAGRDKHCIWVFGPAEERRPVGLVALSSVQRRFRTGELWFVLGDKHYGSRGLTTRAVERLIAYGFGALELRCIYAWTVEINRGGRRLLERTGFRFAGKLRDSHRIDGRWYDRLWYDLLPEEYNGHEEHEPRR